MFEFWNQTDTTSHFFDWPSWDFYLTFNEKPRSVNVAVPDCGRPHHLCSALVMPTSLEYLYMGREFEEGWEQSSWTENKNLHCVATVKNCVIMPAAICTCVYPPRKMRIQDLPGYKQRRFVRACGSVIQPSSRSLHWFVCGAYLYQNAWLVGKDFSHINIGSIGNFTGMRCLNGLQWKVWDGTMLIPPPPTEFVCEVRS